MKMKDSSSFKLLSHEDKRFSLNLSEYEKSLVEGPIKETLRDAFEAGGYEISENAELCLKEDKEWAIREDGKDIFTIKMDADELNIYEDRKLIEHLKEVRKNSVSLINEINNYRKIDKYKDLKKLIELIAISHDFGKSSKYFQNKFNNEKDYNDKLQRHGLISALFGLFLLENYYSFSLKEGFPETVVFRCIRRHHGDLKNFETHFKYSGKSESNYKEVIEIFKTIKENKEEVNDIYNSLLKSKDKEIDYVNEFEKYLESLEKNKEITGTIPLDKTTKFKIKNNEQIFYYYFNLIYSILLESDKKSASNIDDISTIFHPKEDFLKKFKKRFDMNEEFNDIREKIYQESIDNLENCLVDGKSKFMEIDAPTGSGKTLTMLGSAFKIREYLRSEKNLEPQIIYALPFISIIEQNYRVFKDVIEKVKGEVGDDVLLEHHHLADEVFEMSNEKEIDYNKSSFLIENWYSEIVVTTFFQLFKSVFTNKNHLLKKYNKLTNSIILIDEIQAVPPGLYTLIRDCLKILSEKFGSYIILATATKPKLNKKHDSKEKKLTSFKLFDQDDSEYIDDLLMNKYFNRYKVATSHLNERITLNDLEDILKDAVELKNFMVVLNTISNTKRIYEKLEKDLKFDNFEIIYLSTSIPPKTRSQRIKKVSEHIDDNNRFILVTTQLIEAGVDISVERIYRDLAPLDKIAQTAGRTNRNNEKNFSKVLLFELVDEKNDDYPYCRYIYSDLLIEKTRKKLKDYGDVIEEQTLINDILPKYFESVVNDTSQGKSQDKVDFSQQINLLNHKKIENNFKLIKDDLPEISCFIIDDQESMKLWGKYVEISESEINDLEDFFEKKKKFSRIKRSFNRQIVTLRVSSEEEKKDISHKIKFHSELDVDVKECNNIICIDKDADFYDENTGIEIEELDRPFVI